MTDSLYYLVLTALLAAVLWVPFICYRILAFGLEPRYYSDEASRADWAPWARRCHRAHLNLLECLPIFAVLVLALELAGLASAATATAAMVVFWARLAQALVHIAGLPYLRTLAFAVAWLGMLSMGYSAL